MYDAALGLFEEGRKQESFGSFERDFQEATSRSKPRGSDLSDMANGAATLIKYGSQAEIRRGHQQLQFLEAYRSRGTENQIPARSSLGHN